MPTPVLIVWSSSSARKVIEKKGWIFRETNTAFGKRELFQILIEPGITPPEPFSRSPVIDMSDWVNDPTNNDKFDRALTYRNRFGNR